MCNTGGTFGDNSTKQLSLYKCDGRLTDADLCKYLNEFTKLEKSGKLMPLPNGMSMCVETEITSSVSSLSSKWRLFYITIK